MAEFLLVKVFSNHINAARVTDKDHVVGKLFRTEVEVEYRSVTIDYKF